MKTTKRPFAHLERRWGVRFAELPTGVEAIRFERTVIVHADRHDTFDALERRVTKALAHYRPRGVR